MAEWEAPWAGGTPEDKSEDLDVTASCPSRAGRGPVGFLIPVPEVISLLLRGGDGPCLVTPSKLLSFSPSMSRLDL